MLLIVGCTPTQNEEIDQTVTLTMITGSIGREFDVLTNQIKQFEKLNPNITVQLLNLPESSDSRYHTLRSRLQQKDSSFDVFVLNIIWSPEFGANDWTVPLNAYAADYNIDMNEFLPGTIESATWEGELVAMPWFTDVGILYYRQDLLDKYGFAPPKTWDELINIATAIVEAEQVDQPNLVGFVYQGQQYEGMVCNYLEHVWGNGGQVLDDTGRTVVLNTDNSAAALETFASLQQLAPPGILQFTEEDSINYFKNGNAVFMRNWPYAISVLENSQEPIKDQFNITAIPYSSAELTQGIGTIGGWHLAINANSEHPDEAFALIEFLTSLEQQNYKAINASQNPTRIDAFMAPEVVIANPYTPELLLYFLNARPRPVHPRYAEMSDIIQQNVYQTLEGQLTPTDATQEISIAIDAILQESATQMESQP